MITKLIDSILLSIKKIDDSGIRCRAMITLNEDTYEYGWLPFKVNRNPVTKKNLLQIQIDKYSTSTDNWMSYMSFSFRVENEEETVESLLEVINLFLCDGIKMQLDEQEQFL